MASGRWGGGRARAPGLECFVANPIEHRLQGARHREGAGGFPDRKRKVDVLAQDGLEGIEIRAGCRPGVISLACIVRADGEEVAPCAGFEYRNSIRQRDAVFAGNAIGFGRDHQRGDAHKIVDDLGRLPRSKWAAMEDAAAHGLHQGAQFRAILSTPSHDDGEGPIASLQGSAADGGIDDPHAVRFKFLRELAHGFGSDRPHDDEDRLAAVEPAAQAAFPQHDGASLLGGRDQDDGCVAASAVGGAFNAVDAQRGERRAGCFAAVADRKGEARLMDVHGHRSTHGSDADDGD